MADCCAPACRERDPKRDHPSLIRRFLLRARLRLARVFGLWQAKIAHGRAVARESHGVAVEYSVFELPPNLKFVFDAGVTPLDGIKTGCRVP